MRGQRNAQGNDFGAHRKRAIPTGRNTPFQLKAQAGALQAWLSSTCQLLRCTDLLGPS